MLRVNVQHTLTGAVLSVRKRGLWWKRGCFPMSILSVSSIQSWRRCLWDTRQGVSACWSLCCETRRWGLRASQPAPPGTATAPFPWRRGSLGAGISCGERWPWFMNSFNSSHYDKTRVQLTADLCRQSRRGLNEHYIEQYSVRLHLPRSDKLSPADLLHGTISLFCASGEEARPLVSRIMLCCIIHARTCVESVCLHCLCCLLLLQVFAFDHCFWSMDESNVPKYAGES